MIFNSYKIIAFNEFLTGIGLSDVYIKYLQYLPLFSVFFIISFLMTPWIGYLAKKFNILDLPAEQRKNKKLLNKYDIPERHIHQNARALLGGLTTTIGIILLIFFITGINDLTLPILTGVLVITFVGFIDDKVSLPPQYQFFFFFIALTIVAISKIDLININNPITKHILNLSWFSFQTQTFPFPISLVLPGDIIFIFFGLIIINALKWVGGSDGLIEANSIIAYVVVLIIGIRHQQTLTILLSLTILASISGFIPYNLPKAYIQSGSIGKTLYGYLLVILSILNGSKLATSIIVLSLPLADFLLVILFRYKKYKPKNLLDLMRRNDTTHFHHNLLQLNYNPSQILLIEIGITLTFGIVAVFTAGAMKLLALFTIFLITLLGILIIKTRVMSKKNIKKDSPEKKYSY